MDETRLREIEERVGAASYGPWTWNAKDRRMEAPARLSKPVSEIKDDYIRRSLEKEIADGSTWSWVIFGPGGRNSDAEYDDPDDEDAELMAHAREDVPDLVAEVRRQRERIAELEAAKGKRVRERDEEREVIFKAGDRAEVFGPGLCGDGERVWLVRAVGADRKTWEYLGHDGEIGFLEAKYLRAVPGESMPDRPGDPAGREVALVAALADVRDVFMRLPTLHESEREDFFRAIREAQRIVMARPWLRSGEGHFQ